MIYAIVVLAIIAVALAVYVFYFRKGLPLGAKKKTTIIVTAIPAVSGHKPTRRTS